MFWSRRGRKPLIAAAALLLAFAVWFLGGWYTSGPLAKEVAFRVPDGSRRLVGRQVLLQRAQLVHEFRRKVDLLARVVPHRVSANPAGQTARGLYRGVDDHGAAAAAARQPTNDVWQELEKLEKK